MSPGQLTTRSPVRAIAAEWGLDLYERYGLNLLAVSRSGERFTERLRKISLRAGGVLVCREI